MQYQVEIQGIGELIRGGHVVPPWFCSRMHSASLEAGREHLPGDAV